MLTFSKDEIKRAGLCEACTSKFALLGEGLCWDCLYAHQAREVVRRGISVTYKACIAWRRPE
jgi:hypothetical protein